MTDPLVLAARDLAQQAHAGQVDKAGKPYADHPARVASRLDPTDTHGRAVAWLHDALEDTAVTEEQLRRRFPGAVVDAVVAVTRTEEPEDGYYARIAANPLALRVKYADIADNTDPARLAVLDPATRERLTSKYATASRLLAVHAADSAAPAEGGPGAGVDLSPDSP